MRGMEVSVDLGWAWMFNLLGPRKVLFQTKVFGKSVPPQDTVLVTDWACDRPYRPRHSLGTLKVSASQHHSLPTHSQSPLSVTKNLGAK